MRKEEFVKEYDVNFEEFVESGEKQKVWYDLEDESLWIFKLEKTDENTVVYDEYKLDPEDSAYNELLEDSNSKDIQEALEKIESGEFVWRNGPLYNDNWISYVHEEIEL